MGERACRVCGNSEGNRLHRAREMFAGTRDEFDYLECAACGTLHISEVPDLAPYYAGDYYSLRPPEQAAGAGLKKRLARRAATFIRGRAARYYCGRRRPLGELRRPLGRLLAARAGRVVVGFPPYLSETRLDLRLQPDSGVLDVGSGAGATLVSLGHFGFTDLVGVDPFVAGEIEYESGVRVLKAELSDLTRQFDLVLANHSLEHVPDARRALAEIRRVLRPGHYAVIRIPVVARAWAEYGVDWVQLDAPRHLFLYTEQTFRSLAEGAGFSVDEVAYDSTAFQFWGSEQYARDIPLTDPRSYFVNPSDSVFAPEELAAFEARARELNRTGEGDQAIFYLRKV
ncbi:MAG: class I SAM-dependent methyltransferase [Acidobacteria bacterium]|nr:class I SAM-dependent methyltransferase [Acidobacteriota bacterium]